MCTRTDTDATTRAVAMMMAVAPAAGGRAGAGGSGSSSSSSGGSGSGCDCCISPKRVGYKLAQLRLVAAEHGAKYGTRGWQRGGSVGSVMGAEYGTVQGEQLVGHGITWDNYREDGDEGDGDDGGDGGDGDDEYGSGGAGAGGGRTAGAGFVVTGETDFEFGGGAGGDFVYDLASEAKGKKKQKKQKKQKANKGGMGGKERSPSFGKYAVLPPASKSKCGRLGFVSADTLQQRGRCGSDDDGDDGSSSSDVDDGVGRGDYDGDGGDRVLERKLKQLAELERRQNACGDGGGGTDRSGCGCGGGRRLGLSAHQRQRQGARVFGHSGTSHHASNSKPALVSKASSRAGSASGAGTSAAAAPSTSKPVLAGIIQRERTGELAGATDQKRGAFAHSLLTRIQKNWQQQQQQRRGGGGGGSGGDIDVGINTSCCSAGAEGGTTAATARSAMQVQQVPIEPPVAECALLAACTDARVVK